MPIFTIETADGRVLDIEAPDDKAAVAEADRWAAANPRGAKAPEPAKDAGIQIPYSDPMGGFTGIPAPEPAPSQMPYTEQMQRAARDIASGTAGVASGVGQIGTGLGELLPGRAGEASAEATQYLRGIGPQPMQTAGKIAGSIAPFTAGAGLAGAALGFLGRIPGMTNLPPIVQSVGRIGSGAISGAAGGAAVGAGAPTGITDSEERFAQKGREATTEALLGGAFGGGFGLGGEIARAVRSSPLVEIVGQRAANVTPAQFDQAAQLIRDAKSRYNIDLTPAEATEAVTRGATGLGDLQRLMEQSRGGAAMFGEAMAGRPAQIEQAIQRQLDEIAPALSNPSALEPQMRKVAEDINKKVAEMRTRATQPYYQSARDAEINQNAVAAVVKDLRGLAEKDETGQIIAPVLNQLESLLIKTPARGPTPPGPRTTPEGMRAIKVREPGKEAVPEEYITDVNTLEMARQLMRERADVPLSGVEGISKIQSGELLKGLGNLSDRLAKNVPALAQGRAEYESLSRLIDKFKASTTGKFAEAETFAGQRAALFPRGEAIVPGQQGEIQRAFQSIAARDVQPQRMKLPDVQLPPVVRTGAGQQLVRQELESIANRTAGLTAGGLPNEYAGAAFQAAIQRNPQQYANTIAAMQGAGAGAQVPGFQRLMDVLQATGYRMRPGSQTAMNQQFNELVGEGGIPGLARAVATPLTSARVGITQGAIEARTREISQILLSGEAGLRQIQRLAQQNTVDGEIARSILAARNVAVPGLLETRQ
jgi:hypothetical protein